jgi:lipoate-protein ligase A
MLYQATKKVTGGKLVRVKIKADEYINDIQISGDFFLHPEDAIIQVEQNLRNLHRDTTPEEITARINNTLAKENGAFIGLSAEDLTETIIEAFQAV